MQKLEPKAVCLKLMTIGQVDRVIIYSRYVSYGSSITQYEVYHSYSKLCTNFTDMICDSCAGFVVFVLIVYVLYMCVNTYLHTCTLCRNFSCFCYV